MIKDITYKKEEQFLSVYAQKSINSKGRIQNEEECEFRTCFQRDRDRIIHSNSFRRLKNKTQVFLSPDGDHFRTRLTHTLDVSQIARSIARVLSLNEELVEAIALGHDLGHTPFGHAGERVLNRLCSEGFEHSEQSLRVVDVLEHDGKGLNLTYEVRDGIKNHQLKNNIATTLEGRAVCLADKIAYVNHDIDDAIRAEVLSVDKIPKDIIAVLGEKSSRRINTMITSIYRESKGKNCVEMEPEIMDATMRLRDFLNENVYKNCIAKNEEVKAKLMLEQLFTYFKTNIDKIPDNYKKFLEEYSQDRVICDYISSMSDKYAVFVFENIFVPKSWSL